MSAPSVDAKNILEALNIGKMGATNGWAIYIGREPAKPLDCITIFDVSIAPPMFVLSGAVAGTVERAGIQVRVRSSEYETAYDKAREVYYSMFNTGSFVSDDGSYKYLNIFPQSDPLPLGEDDKTRHIFSVNFMAIRTPVV